MPVPLPTRRPVWLPIAASGLSGLLLLAAYPPVDQRWVAFFALIPLLYALRRTSGRGGALAGAAFGLAFFGILLYWISYYGWLAWSALVLSQVAALALFGWFGAWASGRGVVGRLAGVPLLWVGVEMLRTRWPLGGFAWGGLGYTQSAGSPLLGMGRLGGVFAVSLAVAVVNALLLEALAGGRRTAALAAAAAVAGAPAALPVGLAGPTRGRLDVAVVQGNVPRGTFTGFRGQGRVGPEDVSILENHARLSVRLIDDPPDLVIWPENALDRDPFTNPRFGAAVTGTVRAVGAPFLVGAILDAPGDRFYNSNLLFGPDGTLAGRYDKLHLVPFGEYVPWRWLRRHIAALRQIPYDGLTGNGPKVFAVPGALFGSVICFESTYPDLVRPFVRGGAQFLVVSTNDASFEKSPAASQHLQMTRMRAVENGRVVVQAAISGISAVVAPNGGIVQQTDLFEPALMRASIPLAGGLTPYARYGGGIEIGLGSAAGMFALWGAAGATQRRRARPQKRPEREPVESAEPEPPPREERACVVLPTYNEAGTIEEIVSRVLASSPWVDVLVVDDGSPDGTGEIAQRIAAANERVRVLHRSQKLGLGRAYIDGFRQALERGYAWMLEMDSDFSHDPSDIPRFLEAARDADLVIGSRYVPGGGVRNWPKSREWLSRGGNLYSRALLGFTLTDSTSGFRCYRRVVLEALPLDEVHSEGYAFQIEMAWRAWRAGFRVVEIPITFVERREGTSKMSRRIALEALWRVAGWSVSRPRASGTGSWRQARGSGGRPRA
jgi:apolipoprotein N-acyltransferase